MDPIKTFWCEEAGKIKRSFRRYKSGEPCPGGLGYHNAHADLDVIPWPKGEYVGPFYASDFPDDPRWPTKCEHCDYQFADEDERQIFAESIMVRADTGEEFGSRHKPVGALWNAWWIARGERHGIANYVGADGMCLIAQTPGGEWMVDGRANNCTMPEDDEHYCWVRHGDPTTGNVHVDKNGKTCAAGAGSIIAGGWHGFLHNGYFVTC